MTVSKRRILSHRPRYKLIMVTTQKLLSNIRSLEVLILLLLIRMLLLGIRILPPTSARLKVKRKFLQDWSSD